MWSHKFSGGKIHDVMIEEFDVDPGYRLGTCYGLNYSRHTIRV